MGHKPLGRGSIFHASHERPRRSAGGVVDSVSVSSGGRSTARASAPRRKGPLAIDDGPQRGGVVVSPIESPTDETRTPAGRFRTTK